MYARLNKQALFNASVAGLAAQDWKKALNKSGSCSYRGDDGCGCAIGVVIPNSRYRSKWEGLPARRPEVQNMISRKFIKTDEGEELSGDDAMFLSEVQRAHDFSCFISDDSGDTDMKLRLRQVGKNHSLEIPEVLA